MEDHHFQFIAEVDHFGRMLDSLPCHIGDVEEAIDTVEVKEDAEVGNVFNDPAANFAFVDILEHFCFFGDSFFFKKFSAGDDDVFAVGVDFEDFEVVGFDRDIHRDF